MSAGAAILAARDELAQLLTDGGIAVALTDGRVPVPGVLIAAGEPWVEGAGVLAATRRLVSWRAIAVAGRTDQDATVAQLADLVAAIILALVPARPWTLPVASGPRVLLINGADHLASELTARRPVVLTDTGG